MPFGSRVTDPGAKDASPIPAKRCPFGGNSGKSTSPAILQEGHGSVPGAPVCRIWSGLRKPGTRV